MNKHFVAAFAIHFLFSDIFPDILCGLNFPDEKFCDISSGLYFAVHVKKSAKTVKYNPGEN